MVREGETVVVADTAPDAAPTSGTPTSTTRCSAGATTCWAARARRGRAGQLALPDARVRARCPGRARRRAGSPVPRGGAARPSGCPRARTPRQGVAERRNTTPCDDSGPIPRNLSANSVVESLDPAVQWVLPARRRVRTDTTSTRGRCAMGERSLRGSRLGSVSYETERNTAPIERQYAEYRCPRVTCSPCPSPTTPSSPTPGSASSTRAPAKLVGGTEPAPRRSSHADALGHAPGAPFGRGPREVLAERLEVLRGRRTRAS
jgi:hypothetical protein